jgi:hypothetical protein
MATVENKRLKKKWVDAVAHRQPRFRCAARPGRVRGPCVCGQRWLSSRREVSGAGLFCWEVDWLQGKLCIVITNLRFARFVLPPPASIRLRLLDLGYAACSGLRPETPARRGRKPCVESAGRAGHFRAATARPHSGHSQTTRRPQFFQGDSTPAPQTLHKRGQGTRADKLERNIKGDALLLSKTTLKRLFSDRYMLNKNDVRCHKKCTFSQAGFERQGVRRDSGT